MINLKIDDKETIEFITYGINDDLLKEVLIKSCTGFYSDIIKFSASLKSSYLRGRNAVVEYLSKSTINDISLRHYCECLKYIEAVNWKPLIKSGARKFLIHFYNDITETDINLNNINYLKEDKELLIWNLERVSYQTLIEIIDEIESIKNMELKSLIKIYVKSISIDELENLGSKVASRCRVLALKSILILLRDTKIIDISWKHYCEIMRFIRNHENKLNRIWMRKIIYDIYNIVLNNHKYKNKELNHLRKNRQFIKWEEPSSDSGDSEFMMDHIKTFYPIDSRIENLYLYYNNEGNEDSIDCRVAIFNINTSNQFLKSIMGEYIISRKDYEKRIYDREKLFLYHLEISFCDLTPFKIEDITMETYRKQYLFYCLLEDEYNNGKFNKINNIPITINHNKFPYILRGFYFFILNYLKEKKIEHNIFVGSNITEYIFSSSKFDVFIRGGFEFVMLAVNDVLVPRFEKWAIIPDGIGSGLGSESIIGIDFTRIKWQGYIEDLQNYYWKGNRNNVRTTVLREYGFVVDFLNHKYEFDQRITPIFNNTDLTVDFGGRFLSNYVSYIKTRYSSNDTQYSAFGAVKSLLKYISKIKKNDGQYKYSIDKLGLKEFKAKINKNKGGNPIPIYILNLILNELEKRRYKSDEAELIYTIIYMMINSKLRVGEILNLERDCINYDSQGFIKYVSKISYGEIIEEQFTNEILEMIIHSKEITEKYVELADERLQKYIFIVPDGREKRILRIKKLASGVNTEIKRIINALIESGIIVENMKEDILKHCCYDIRDTRIDSLYKKGIEEGISPLEIATMAGNTIQVGMSNYIAKMNKMNFIEIFAGVKIANVNIKGEILETDEELEIKVKYKDEFGGCSNVKCREKIAKEDYSFSCLICNQFTTCKSRADVFKLKIKELKAGRDKELENGSQSRIDFINKKIELYTVYLSKML